MTLMTDKKKWYTEQILDCQASLYRLAMGLLHNEEDALDALQDALCTGYEKLNTLQDPDIFRPWIMRIATNSAYDILRRQRRFLEFDELEEVPQAEPSVSPSETMDLKQAVAALPPDYRIIVLLFYYEDLTVRQIGAVTGLSSDVIRTRLFRARKLLKKLLDE